MIAAPDQPSYVLFALAAKHAMDCAMRFQRAARAAADSRTAAFYVDLACLWRSGAWDHLEAARTSKRRAFQ